MRRSALTLLTALTVVLLQPTAAEASGDTVGAWRRWPWRNGTAETLTQVGGHDYASASAQKAIDVAMRNKVVHSIGPGKVVTVATDPAAGSYVQVLADDGSVITYEHLSRFETAIGTRLWQGDPIAVSGSSGNVTGPHLHFQRSRTTSFDSDALPLAPIDGVYDPVRGMQAKSANAGIGTNISGGQNDAIRTGFTRYGGWATIGAPQTLTPARTPCWSSGRTPTRWMYACAGGAIQTFEKGSADTLLLARDSIAFRVAGAFHVVLVSRHPNGREYLDVIGFPRADVVDRSPRQSQLFERGRISWEAGSCTATVTVDGESSSRSVPVC